MLCCARTWRYPALCHIPAQAVIVCCYSQQSHHSTAQHVAGGGHQAPQPAACRQSSSRACTAQKRERLHIIQIRARNFIWHECSGCALGKAYSHLATLLLAKPAHKQDVLATLPTLRSQSIVSIQMQHAYHLLPNMHAFLTHPHLTETSVCAWSPAGRPAPHPPTQHLRPHPAAAAACPSGPAPSCAPPAVLLQAWLLPAHPHCQPRPQALQARSVGGGCGLGRVRGPTGGPRSGRQILRGWSVLAAHGAGGAACLLDLQDRHRSQDRVSWGARCKVDAHWGA
jgi:hypothetical protein